MYDTKEKLIKKIIIVVGNESSEVEERIKPVL